MDHEKDIPKNLALDKLLQRQKTFKNTQLYNKKNSIFCLIKYVISQIEWRSRVVQNKNQR